LGSRSFCLKIICKIKTSSLTSASAQRQYHTLTIVNSVQQTRWTSFVNKRIRKRFYQQKISAQNPLSEIMPRRRQDRRRHYKH